jgi:hypothetical protein
MKAGERSLRDQMLFEQAQELLMLSQRCGDATVAADLRKIVEKSCHPKFDIFNNIGSKRT